MSAEADFTQAKQGFQDGASQVFWTIGGDHRLYRIELRPGRGAIATLFNPDHSPPTTANPASRGRKPNRKKEAG
jgi:hypothetical protein